MCSALVEYRKTNLLKIVTICNRSFTESEKEGFSAEKRLHVQSKQYENR